MKTNNLISAAALGMTLLLSACASSEPQVTLLDGDIYMISTQAMFYGISATAEGVKQADAYCRQRSKHMELTNSESADGSLGVIRARSVVMFRCVG